MKHGDKKYFGEVSFWPLEYWYILLKVWELLKLFHQTGIALL
jgi:hypothetical protein